MKKAFSFIVSLILISNIGFSQKMTAEAYIERYKKIAVKEMIKYGIPASITLAQGLLESGNGNSRLAVKGNNHFGIKCHKGWQGDSIHHDDDAKGECFRVYDDPEASYEDHSIFLRTRDRYSFLFEFEKTDYIAWAYGLKDAGYATNPRYPELLVSLIERHNLSRFDTITTIYFDDHFIAENKENDKVSTKATDETPEKNDKFEVSYPGSDTEHQINIIQIGSNNRKVQTNNRTPFVIAKETDDMLSIAEDFQMGTWQIKKYNDLDKASKLKKGDVVYIKPKRRKTFKDIHVVEGNETLHDISQKYGIKLKLLYKRNYLEDFSTIKEGDKIFLNYKKDL